MAGNIVQYEGSETVEAPGTHWEPIIVKKQNLPLEVGIGLTIGLALTGLILWSSKRLAGGDIGDHEDDFLTQEFSKVLGLRDGALFGMPIKYKLVPAVRGGFRRPGHPAAIEITLTVRNPRNVRMHVHKEGVFNKPMGFLPPEAEAPPLMDSHGFALRLEPADALDAGAMRSLDKAFNLFCAAGLYEAKLKGNDLFIHLIRSRSYDIEEGKDIFTAAGEMAAFFN